MTQSITFQVETNQIVTTVFKMRKQFALTQMCIGMLRRTIQKHALGEQLHDHKDLIVCGPVAKDESKAKMESLR